MEDLKTSYLDDILSATMGGKRKFRLTKADGSAEEVTIEDISEYDQVGSTFGAGDLNNICDTVNNKFYSDDVVDPMVATEEGFAADALRTKEALDEQNKKILVPNWKSIITEIEASGGALQTTIIYTAEKPCVLVGFFEGVYINDWTLMYLNDILIAACQQQLNVQASSVANVYLPLQSGDVITTNHILTAMAHFTVFDVL